MSKVNFKQAVANFSYWCTHVVIPQKQWKKDPYRLGVRAIRLSNLKIAPHQEELVEMIEDKEYQQLVVIKSRQQGCTTILALYMLWRCLYKTGYKCLFMIDHADKAKSFRQLIEKAYDSLPEELKVPLRFTHSDRIYNDELRSSIVIVPATLNAGRSETYTFGYVDELDFMSSNVQTAVMSAVMASCQKVVVACTPMFEGGRFHRMVEQARSDGRLYKKDFDDIASGGFYGSPENAKKWYRFITEGKDEADIRREYHCEFSAAKGDLICRIPQSSKISIPEPQGAIVVGIDIGWKDSTYVLFGSVFKNKMYLFDELSFKTTNLHHICDTIKGKGYRIKWGAIDSQAKKVDLTSGQSPYDLIQSRLRVNLFSRKPLKHTGKNTGVILLNDAFDQGKVFYDPDKVPLLETMFNNFMYGKRGDIPHTSYLVDRFDALVYLLHNWGKVPTGRRPRTLGWDDMRTNRRSRFDGIF